MKDIFTVRDRFAMKAMERLFTPKQDEVENYTFEIMAKESYIVANAMMLARNLSSKDLVEGDAGIFDSCEIATMTNIEEKEACKDCGIYHFSDEQLHDAQVENDRLALVQERAVLGYLILNLPNNMLDSLNKTGIDEGHFQGSNKTLFSHISHIIRYKSETCNFDDLINSLRDSCHLGEIGGTAEILNLMKEAPMEDFNLADSCSMIIESDILRESREGL